MIVYDLLTYCFSNGEDKHDVSSGPWNGLTRMVRVFGAYEATVNGVSMYVLLCGCFEVLNTATVYCIYLLIILKREWIVQYTI